MGTPQKAGGGSEASEATIAVHWREEEYFHPSEKFIQQANLRDPAVNERFSEKNFPKCFEEYAEMLDWYVVADVQLRAVYVALKPGVHAGHEEMISKVTHTIETMIGKIARPKAVRIVPDMPKTRSGKIMRRVLAAISNNMNVGDITTLANPDIVEEIRVQVQGKGPVVMKEGPEDIHQFGKVE